MPGALDVFYDLGTVRGRNTISRLAGGVPEPGLRWEVWTRPYSHKSSFGNFPVSKT